MLRALGVLLCLATSAHAEVLSVYGDIQGGAMYGQGIAGDEAVKSQDFFSNVANTTYGAAVSARFLFLGATIQHHQYAGLNAPADPDGSGNKLATWTQIIAGLDFGLDMGSEQQKKKREGSFLQIGAGVGFGVGTGQQVKPPLSNDQIDQKGFLAEAKLGFGKHLGSVFDAGVLVPVTYGYFIKNGVAANNVDNHLQGVHVEALVFLRLHIGLL